jgi:hypothetical protein
VFVDECQGIFGDLRILPVNVVEDFDFLFGRTFSGLCVTGKRPDEQRDYCEGAEEREFFEALD